MRVSDKALKSLKREDGSILLISLMLLIVLTLLTFSSSKSVILQEKMVAGSRDGIVALEGATLVLAQAKLAVNTNAYIPAGSAGGYYDGSQCNGIDLADETCTHLANLTDLYKASAWTKSTPVTTSVKCVNGGVGCRVKGRYMIVYLGDKNIPLSKFTDSTVISSDIVETNNTRNIGSNNLSSVYKIIAKAQGLNEENERIIVAHYAVSR